MATLISGDDVATSAEEIYGSLRHVVKPILEKISLSTPTGTASLKPAYFSLVPTSLKKWYRRWLLLTGGVLPRTALAVALVARCPPPLPPLSKGGKENGALAEAAQ